MMYLEHVANIHDVARLAGVSATTAKRAIRDPDKLAQATLERVRQAIEELQYEPDQVASALRSGHNNTVGLVIGSIVEPFFAHLTRAIGRSVRHRGYSLSLADSEYRTDLELEHLRRFQGNRVAGLILRSGFGPANLEYLLRMQRRGTAIVEVDFFYDSSPFSHVMLDNEAAIRRGVDYLVSLGHRRITTLGIYHPELNTDERVRAFPEAMAGHGLPLDPRTRRAIPPTQEAAYDLTHELMQLSDPPTALFALTGNMAIGAYQALRERQLVIPDDVSLLAFDDYPWTSLVEPGIDVLAQPVEAMGARRRSASCSTP
jgi:LacI family transcriptional regulator